MHRLLSRRVAILGVCLSLVGVSPPPASFAQTEQDSTDVDATSGERASSIRIDESGILIETQDEGSDSTVERRIIFDTSRRRDLTPRRYREKGSDVVKFGEDVYIGSDELVRGDIVMFGGDVMVEGKIIGNVVVIGGDARIRSGAEINGDVVVFGGTIDEEPDVLIHGERVMFRDLSIPFQAFPHVFGSDYSSRFLEFFFIPVQFFIAVMLAFLTVLFMRDRVQKGQEHVQASFLKSFGAGFLTVFVGFFVVTVLGIILLITLIGIPLAFVLFVSCAAVFIIALTVFAYALGVKVNDRLKLQTTNPFAVVLVGTAVLYLPTLIGYGISLWPLGGPVGGLFKFVGCLFFVFAVLVGIGALFLSRFGGRGVSPETAAPVAAE